MGIIYTTAYEAEPFGITREIADYMEMFTMLETCPVVYGELRKRGLRILPGGDYGFAWNPIGTNARDFAALRQVLRLRSGRSAVGSDEVGAARSWAWEGNSGLVKPGYLADLLLLDGDPCRIWPCSSIKTTSLPS